MPPETALAFGLHPNAEIGFKLREAETFCNSLVQLQPRESGGECACVTRHHSGAQPSAAHRALLQCVS
jgi:hypothetical protein